MKLARAQVYCSLSLSQCCPRRFMMQQIVVFSCAILLAAPSIFAITRTADHDIDPARCCKRRRGPASVPGINIVGSSSSRAALTEQVQQAPAPRRRHVAASTAAPSSTPGTPLKVLVLCATASSIAERVHYNDFLRPYFEDHAHAPPARNPTYIVDASPGAWNRYSESFAHDAHFRELRGKPDSPIKLSTLRQDTIENEIRETKCWGAGREGYGAIVNEYCGTGVSPDIVEAIFRQCLQPGGSYFTGAWAFYNIQLPPLRTMRDRMRGRVRVEYKSQPGGQVARVTKQYSSLAGNEG